MLMFRLLLFAIISCILFACTHTVKNEDNKHSNDILLTPYESVSITTKQSFKKVFLPFSPGTRFLVSQGAFGKSSHSEPGNEYSWDFDVPFGTSVLAVEDGIVIDIRKPNAGSGCNYKFSDVAHNINILRQDGTVAQYVHINSKVKVGEHVKKGDIIAVTAENGWICRPQLHFGIYRSVKTLYNSPNRETIPLFFEAIPDGIACEGKEYVVPLSKNIEKKDIYGQ
ncbi:MAG: M23 family metallopeptidase [Oligoflexia bacterium]|nr:M23 family metallopeptidase [Oligoflexia bacterium]